MYTTMLLSLIAQHMLLKRGVGERHWIVDYINGIMYSFTLIMHLSSLSTDGRKRGRKGQQRTDNIEKIHPLEFEHPLLWNQCYVTLSKRGEEKKKKRAMETTVFAYRYECCKCRTKCSTNKSLLGSSCTGFSEGGCRLD